MWLQGGPSGPELGRLRLQPQSSAYADPEGSGRRRHLPGMLVAVTGSAPAWHTALGKAARCSTWQVGSRRKRLPRPPWIAGRSQRPVVVAEIALQVEPEAGLLGNQVAGKGRLPAFVQDGLLDPLHTAVGLGRPARMKLCRAPREAMAVWKVAERNSWALSLMTRSSRQPRLARSDATWRARALVQVAAGLRRVTCRVAQV
jgi:hypothetical protein